MSNDEQTPKEPELTPAEQRVRDLRKLYAVLNVIFIVYIPAFLLALIFVQERLLMTASLIADIGLLLLLNGCWLVFSKLPSIFFRRGGASARRTGGVIFLVAAPLFIGAAVMLFIYIL